MSDRLPEFTSEKEKERYFHSLEGEEKIDALINSKVELAENVIGGGENWITEMSDSALLDLMRLEV